MKIVIDDGLAGLTIKKVLFDKLHFSRAAVTALKKKPDGIRVDGEHKTVRYRLAPGETLTLNLEDAESSAKVRPSAGEIEILYEDEAFLCVNKPPHMAVHPSKKLQDDTLAGRILYHRAPIVFRAAGRLDKDTSGAVICSKNKVVASAFSEKILRHEIHKEYLALCEGEGDLAAEGKIDLCIRRDPESYITRTCFEPDGSESVGERAETVYRVLLENGAYRLILASPITGRTHQLRAHFSAVGFPIVGDTLYGKKSEIIPRQALHALRLSFSHPETGEEMRLFAPLHKDFQCALETVFGAAGRAVLQELERFDEP